MYDMIYLTTSG